MFWSKGLVNSVCQCLTNVRVGPGIVFATVKNRFEVPSSSCAHKASTQSGRQQALQTFKHIMQAHTKEHITHKKAKKCIFEDRRQRNLMQLVPTRTALHPCFLVYCLGAGQVGTEQWARICKTLRSLGIESVYLSYRPDMQRVHRLAESIPGLFKV